MKHRLLSIIGPIGFCLTVLATQSVFAHHPLERSHEQQVMETPTADIPLKQVREWLYSFQVSGDDRHLDKAWDLLSPALSNDLPAPEVLISAAFVAQSRHDFAQAHVLLEKVLEQHPYDSQAWLLKASLHLLKAESEPAAQACRQLQRVSLLVVLSCHSKVAMLNGNSERAYASLNSLLKQDHSTQASTEILAWSFSVVGDLAVETNRLEEAAGHYQRSLNLQERSQVRAALVDAQMSQGDYANAWRTVNTTHLALPLLVRKFVIAKHTGRLSSLQNEIDSTGQAFERWIANQDWRHAREMARFYLDVEVDLKRATMLATVNAGLQREPEDLRLLARVNNMR